MTISVRTKRKTLRIAILAPEFYHAWGGVGSYAHALVKGLMRHKGLELHVLTPDIVDQDQRSRIDKEYQGKVHIHTLSTARDTFLYNLAFQWALLRGFGRLHKTYNFDIIHSLNLVHMPDIFLKFTSLDIPSVVTVHTTISGQVQGTRMSGKGFLEMALSEKLSLLTYPYIRLMERLYLRRTDQAITVSRRFKKLVKKEFGFKGKVSTIHNSIDLGHYRAGKVSIESALRRFPGLKKRRPTTVLFAGRLVALKGIDILMQAIKKLEDRGQHHTYLLAGRGSGGFIKRLKRQYGVEKADIRYMGHVPQHDLPDLFKAADIFVLPSFTENLPITLMEAMAMDCCCVASDVGSVHEIITDRKEGLLVPAGHPGALADALNSAATDTLLRERLITNARNKSVREFGNDQMAKATIKVYKDLLERTS